MARLIARSDDGAIEIEIHTDDEGDTWGVCPACRDRITDRGDFEDTVQAVAVHLDRHGSGHPLALPQ